MEGPISPAPVVGGAGRELPAYLSNGIVGLKVRDNPLSPGMTLLCGFSGEHPERKIEAVAFAPYPIAGDVSLDGVWMSEATHDVRIVDQACNFSTGELTTRLTFRIGGHQAKIAVMAFCSRDQPTLVCQEISLEVDGACDIRVRANIDLSGIEGRAEPQSQTNFFALQRECSCHRLLCHGKSFPWQGDRSDLSDAEDERCGDGGRIWIGSCVGRQPGRRASSAG